WPASPKFSIFNFQFPILNPAAAPGLSPLPFRRLLDSLLPFPFRLLALRSRPVRFRPYRTVVYETSSKPNPTPRHSPASGLRQRHPNQHALGPLPLRPKLVPPRRLQSLYPPRRGQSAVPLPAA